MQLLRDNLTLWTSSEGGEGEGGGEAAKEGDKAAEVKDEQAAELEAAAES